MKPGLNEGPDLTGYAVRHETRASPTSEWDLAIDWTHSGTGTTTTPGKITEGVEKGCSSWHNVCAIKRLCQ